MGLITRIFKKQLSKALSNDSILQNLLKDGDEIIDSQKNNTINLMISGIEVPYHLKKYVNYNNLTEEEKNSIRIKIREAIHQGNCPTEEVLRISNFDDTEPIYEKYLRLKGKSDKKKKIQKNATQKRKEQKIKDLISKFGKNNYEKAIKGELCLDMDEELLILAKGKPSKKDSNLVKGKKSEVWYYDEYTNRLKTKSYKFSVRLVEGKIKGYKNL